MDVVERGISRCDQNVEHADPFRLQHGPMPRFEMDGDGLLGRKRRRAQQRCHLDMCATRDHTCLPGSMRSMKSTVHPNGPPGHECLLDHQCGTRMVEAGGCTEE
jgi:hypothetical protein